MAAKGEDCKQAIALAGWGGVASGNDRWMDGSDTFNGSLMALGRQDIGNRDYF